MRWRGHVHIVPFYQAGDPPPAGYLEWHEWAGVQHRAGLRQAKCGHCALWRFPQEMSRRAVVSELIDRRGRPVPITAPLCSTCVESR